MISIIVPACGQVALTRRCVQSIRRWTTDVDYELVLVSNGSSPEEAEELAALCERDGDVFVHSDRMLGYPRAVNEGVRRALGEYVCLLNNDAAFTGPWARRLVAALDLGAVVSPIVDNIGQPAQRLGDRWAPGTLSAAGMLFFVCVLLRRALFWEIGGLDERFGLGNGEDVAFCNAVKARQGLLLVEPAVFVTHAGSATFLAVLGQEGYQELMAQNVVLRGELEELRV